MMFDSEFLSNNDNNKEEILKKMQNERIQNLTIQLLNKIETFMNGNILSFEKEVIFIYILLIHFYYKIENDIAEKVAVPGGLSLLYSVGYIYEQEGKKHLNRYIFLKNEFFKYMNYI